MTRYLITGGCGFLGSNLAAEVLARHEELVVLDDLSRHGAQQNLAWLRTLGAFAHIEGDIRDTTLVDHVVFEHRPDVVFHLAGQVAMTTSIADPVGDFGINAVGTLNVLEALRRHAPEAVLLYSSTNKVYGDLEQFGYEETATRYRCVERPQGFDEETPLCFHSPYGCSKGAADQYVLDYARMFGLRTAVFRHSSMYGGRQFATRDQGWVGWFCQQALEAKVDAAHEFTISGNGKQVRDVLHADDMRRLYFAAVEHIDRIVGQPFNVGGGMANSLSLIELIALLEELVGVKLRYRQLPPRESDQRVFVANLRKISAFTGWEPRVNAREGVGRMVAWVAGSGVAPSLQSSELAGS